MYSPECWTFLPSANQVKYEEGCFRDKPKHCASLIDRHYFNHAVSVILPSVNHCPESISAALTEDCSYYYVKDVGVEELVCKEFIDAFVKKGELTILSDGTQIDIDDCLALTPSSHLILSLQTETYQELGLEGKASFFSKKNPQRFVVDLDLLEENFVPGKKRYDRVKKCLAERLNVKFNLLVAWDSPEETVCPSSVAAYFNDRGFTVLECTPNCVQREDKQVAVPLLDPNDIGACTPAELVEWMGAYSLRADLTNHPDSYISSYQVPLKNRQCKNVHYLQWTGFFTYRKIQELFEKLRIWIPSQHLSPWACLYVQGFSDSPVSWGLQEHNFYDHGDNNYAMFMRPDEQFLTCSVLSGTKRPRSKLNK